MWNAEENHGRFLYDLSVVNYLQTLGAMEGFLAKGLTHSRAARPIPTPSSTSGSMPTWRRSSSRCGRRRIIPWARIEGAKAGVIGPPSPIPATMDYARQVDLLRTTALMGSFVLAGAVATRFGDASIGAHQVAFQLFIFLALLLDSIAIAGQIIVGRELGSGRRESAYRAGERMIWLSIGLGGVFAALMLVLSGVLPRIFTGDDAVLDETALLSAALRADATVQRRRLRARRHPHRRRRRSLPGDLDGDRVRGVRERAPGDTRGRLGDPGRVGGPRRSIVVRLTAMSARFRRGRWLVTGWT